MEVELLKNTIEKLFANGKGILAMDESTPTCDKRFEANGIPKTSEMRRKYRQLIIKTQDLSDSIGGAILYEETLHQKTDDGEFMATALLKAGIIPGIKVDQGTKILVGFENEKITEGLDGLQERLVAYKIVGVLFAKWRAVITIGDGIPTDACIHANVIDLARYAAICQQEGIVPIVEPEVLMDGNHSFQECYDVTEKVLKSLFYQLYLFKVNLEGIILKPNMILAGKENKTQHTEDEVAMATVKCFLSSVPAAVPVIAFLSGGQSPEKAAAHLNAINKNFRNHLPWIVSFSFARAIQEPALETWKGNADNVREAQKLLYRRAKIASAARLGEYEPAMEKQDYYS